MMRNAEQVFAGKSAWSLVAAGSEDFYVKMLPQN
jgi:hypothetical protein